MIMGRTRSLETEIRIDAPIEAVWDALTRAEELVRWFPLEAGENADDSMWMSWGEGFWFEGRAAEVDPPHRPIRVPAASTRSRSRDPRAGRLRGDRDRTFPRVRGRQDASPARALGIRHRRGVGRPVRRDAHRLGSGAPRAPSLPREPSRPRPRRAPGKSALHHEPHRSLEPHP
jgi:hypothetical protein